MFRNEVKRAKGGPSFGMSLLPIVLLVAFLSVNVYVFGDASLDGSIQIVLLVISAIVAAISMLGYGKTWSEIEEGVTGVVVKSLNPLFVLLFVGALSGAWMHSGIIPTMIYYGMQIISPQWLLVTSCIVSAIVSVSTGSSWTTIATVGVGLMGVGHVLGVPEGWVAGAIISGAYFGDKISPLSDTTNLASSVAGVDLFDHIKFMLRTTIPSLLVALAVYTLVGLQGEADSAVSVMEMADNLEGTFVISPWLLLVPLGVFYLIYKGFSALIVLFVGSLVGALLIPFVQPQQVALICNHPAEGFLSGFEAVMRAVYGSVQYPTGSATLDDLVATGGMRGMLNTIWLVLCAMCFGGTLEASGMLRTLTERMMVVMRGRLSTVGVTSASCLFLNVTASDQYISIILPGKMYEAVFKHHRLDPRLLSRTLEDSATVTSVLVPWNTCGMTQAAVLGVATVVYAPYTVFCWISPIMTLTFAFVNRFTKRGKGGR